MSMNLNLWRWQWFCLDKLFDIWAGKYYYKDDYSDWDTPYCSAAATNNWIIKKIDIEPDFPWNQIVTWKVWCTAFYQPEPFCATSDVNVLTPRFSMNTQIWLFITSVINAWENYKWNYWRQCRVWDTKWISIKLPVQCDSRWEPIIDETYNFSEEWYIPDWQFMEDYIKSLHHKPITTNMGGWESLTLDVNKRKEFKFWDLLSDIYKAKANAKSDINTKDNEESWYIPFVTRTDNDNWVDCYALKEDVREIEDWNAIVIWDTTATVSYQKDRFSTWDHIVIARAKRLNTYTWLFITTLLRQEKFRYNYWRAFVIDSIKNTKLLLPINEDWEPNRQFMENYIKNLPYSDRI